MEIIKLSNISFSYSHQKTEENIFFSDLSFSVKRGEFISILGPNGSGKSTFLKIIANILEPISGLAELYNQEYKTIKRAQFARHVAFVPQNSGTNFPYSIYEIVMMGRSPYLNFLGIQRENDHKLVLDTLDLLEIIHLKNNGINEVSGGEAQRALIARAIVQKPEILLLDEPNAHLDIKHQISIFNLLHDLNIEKKLTVIAVSHDLNLSNSFSSRTVLMKSGKIMYDSIPEKILTESNIKKIFGVESKIVSSKEIHKPIISLIHKP